MVDYGSSDRTNLISDATCHKFTSSSSSSSMNSPLCRICHLVDNTQCDPMISPCRCSGTMQFVHMACLVHWLELSSRKMSPKPYCELCGYNFKRHSCFNLREIHFPRMQCSDILLNSIFVMVVILMVICAILCIQFIRISEHYRSLRPYRSSNAITKEDSTIIACSAIFFSAFFVAVFTQYRAEVSLFCLISRFWQINRNWQIRNYEVSQDSEKLQSVLVRADSLEDVCNVANPPCILFH